MDEAGAQGAEAADDSAGGQAGLPRTAHALEQGPGSSRWSRGKGRALAAAAGEEMPEQGPGSRAAGEVLENVVPHSSSPIPYFGIAMTQ